jgi:uncharacterized damage-inducible protein DinB
LAFFLLFLAVFSTVCAFVMGVLDETAVSVYILGMNTSFTVHTLYNQGANAAVYGLLSALSNEEREKARGSFYGSLSGLARHLAGGTGFFAEMLKGAVKNPAAKKALEPTASVVRPPEGELTEAQWQELGKTLATLDKAMVEFCRVLTVPDLETPVKWMTGDPETVPVWFMLATLAHHNTHHRGQISQILDEMKVEHNFSGVSPEYLQA